MRMRIAAFYLGLAFLPACGDNPTRATPGGTPVRFIYTLSFVDDLGPGSTSVEVPVR